MGGKTVLIIGGGVGGLVTVNRLRRLLGRQHRIVLVEKNPVHAFPASFLWLMVGRRTRREITRGLGELVYRGVDVVVGEATGLDLERRVVEVGGRPLSFDVLVLAPGADLAWDALPGLRASQTFFTLDGAERLLETLRGFRGGSVAVVVAGTPYKCPGAPHEGAMLIADYLRQRGLSSATSVQLFTPEPQPMPVAGPELGQAVEAMLASRGVGFQPLHKLVAFEPETGTLRFADREPVRCDVAAVIPPHRAPALVREAGLVNGSGWVPVDAATLATRAAAVFAIGDATAIPLPGRWKPEVPLMLPKAGVFAHAQGEVVARRIAAEVNGQVPKEVFCGPGYCMLEAGEDLAGFAFGDFFATPSPQVHLRRMGKAWHLGKVLFERWWLARPGPRREALSLAITLGGKVLGVPVAL